MPESSPAVWHITTAPLDQWPWCRFTIETMTSNGRFRWHTVAPEDALASLAVWLQQAAADAADRPPSED